jgi:hypothetical protein
MIVKKVSRYHHAGNKWVRIYSSYSFLTLALVGVSGQRHALAVLYPRGKDPPVPIVQEAGWAPEPVWTQRLEEKSFRLCRESNPYRPVVQFVVSYKNGKGKR